MDRKCQTLLRDLPPDEEIEIPVEGRPPLRATPRVLMRIGRFSGALSLDQLEWAFSARPLPTRH